MTKFTPSLLIPVALLTTLHLFGQDEVIPRARPVEPDFGGAATSESGQFIVRGGDGALRGSVALLADQTRDELLRLTAEPHAKSIIPIHVQLVDTPNTHLITKNITYHDDGYDIRLTVYTKRGLDVERFQHAITAALIYERSLANREMNDKDTPLLIPPWLVEGLREANRWQLELNDRRLYEALFRSGGIYKIDDLFTMNAHAHESLDAASRAAFQVSSGALVMALLEQPDGTDAFRKFLAEVPRFTGEMPTLLRRYFPELNLSEKSMAKWWLLQIASKSTARLTDSLSIFETESSLENALRLYFRDDQGVLREESIEAWTELLELDLPERIAATRMAADALVRLSYRSFPSYRPLLISYQETLIMLQQQKTSTDAITERLDELTAIRQNIIAKAERARDYLDWFEITRARETSGAFDDYLRLKKQLNENLRGQRHDPITKMLDRFDQIFHRVSNSRPTSPPQDW